MKTDELSDRREALPTGETSSIRVNLLLEYWSGHASIHQTWKRQRGKNYYQQLLEPNFSKNHSYIISCVLHNTWEIKQRGIFP